MEEWEKHIIDVSVPVAQGGIRRTWCGEYVPSMIWMFQDVGHAALACRDGYRMRPCPACASAVIKALQGEP